MRYFFLSVLPLTGLLLSACGASTSDSDFVDSGDGICQPVSYTKITPPSGNNLDPLLDQQWYLQALGILNSGLDWLTAQSGDQIQVAVLDNNLDYEHEDLYSNINHKASCHFVDSKLSNLGSHATDVSGVISAVRNNGTGVAGIAPNTEISGFNILRSDSLHSQWNVALGGEDSTQTDHIDIYNQSFGYSNITEPFDYDLMVDAALEYGTQHRRSGKGALYFKASGNNFEFDTSCLVSTRELPLDSANMDPDNNVPYNIVVGSVGEDGTRACYSSSGSSVMLVAPGDFLHTTSDHNNYHDFTGSSAATPVASAVAALILEANPNLGWRDVRHIMLSTAEQVDIDIAPFNLSLPDGDYEAEPGWQNNAAGYHFHNWYGFGRISVDKAISATQNYGDHLPEQQVFSSDNQSVNQDIPDNLSTGISSSLTIDQSLTTESIQLFITLSHTRPSDLAIEITSPSGSRSLLMTPLNRYRSQSDSPFELVLTSHLFYGEPTQGEWQLKVVDVRSSFKGQVIEWSLQVYGH